MKYLLRYVCAYCVARLAYRAIRGRRYRAVVTAKPCTHIPWGILVSIVAAPFVGVVALIVIGFVVGR